MKKLLNKNYYYIYSVVPENIHTPLPPTQKVFFVWIPPHLQKFQFKIMVSFKKLCFWKPPPLGISINLPFLGAGNDIFWNRILNKSGPYFTNYLLITAMALAIIWLQWKWHNMWQSKTNSFIFLILSYIFPAFSWDVYYKETVQGMLN